MAVKFDPMDPNKRYSEHGLRSSGNDTDKLWAKETEAIRRILGGPSHPEVEIKAESPRLRKLSVTTNPDVEPKLPPIAIPGSNPSRGIILTSPKRRSEKGEERVSGRGRSQSLSSQEAFQEEHAKRGRAASTAVPITIPSLSLVSPRALSQRKLHFTPRDSSTAVFTPLKDLELITDERQEKKFNDDVRDKINLAKSKPARTEVTAQELDKIIFRVVRDELSELYQQSSSDSMRDLRGTERERARQLCVLIQKGGAILVPIVERLADVKSALHTYLTYHGKKTQWTERLAIFLDVLISPNDYAKDADRIGVALGKDLQEFINALTSLSSGHVDKRIQEIVTSALGDTGKAQKDVLAALKRWNEEVKGNSPRIQRYMHDIDCMNADMANIPYIQHEWEESGESNDCFGKIPLFEFLSTFFTGKHEKTLSKDIVINGESLLEKMQADGASEQLEKYPLLFKLFSMIYKKFDESVSVADIHRQACRVIESERDHHPGELTEATVPCIQILRLLTSSAWKPAHEYLTKLFPKLFEGLYHTVEVDEMESQIEIESSKMYSVRQQRNYAVFMKKAGIGLESKEREDRKRLAEFVVVWTLKNTAEGWKGVLNLARGVQVSPTSSDEDRLGIVNAVIHYTDLSIEPHAPKDSPKMRSIYSHGKIDTQ